MKQSISPRPNMDPPSSHPPPERQYTPPPAGSSWTSGSKISRYEAKLATVAAAAADAGARFTGNTNYLALKYPNTRSYMYASHRSTRFPRRSAAGEAAGEGNRADRRRQRGSPFSPPSYCSARERDEGVIHENFV